MPTYEYECLKCGDKFELQRGIDQSVLEENKQLVEAINRLSK